MLTQRKQWLSNTVESTDASDSEVIERAKAVRHVAALLDEISAKSRRFEEISKKFPSGDLERQLTN